MSNEATKEQIKRFLQNAVDRAKNPDPYDKMRKIRQIKAKKIQKTYGF